MIWLCSNSVLNHSKNISPHVKTIWQCASCAISRHAAELHTAASSGSRKSRWCDGNPHGYPVDELRSLVAAPVLNGLENVFKSSEIEMREADAVFSDHRKLEAVMRVVDRVPDYAGTEVCFIGRSNAGKSSLIKSLLFNPTKLPIKVSKTPGRTRTLNFYCMGRAFSLVDMPGYGENMPEHYVQSVEQYIKNRNNLRRTFLLIDAGSTLDDVDKIGVEMMEEFGRPYTIVLTKIDSTSHSRALRQMLDTRRLVEETRRRSAALSQFFLVSSQQNIGLSLLRSYILHVCDVRTSSTLKQSTS